MSRFNVQDRFENISLLNPSARAFEWKLCAWVLLADLVTSAKRAETRERIERKRKELRNWQTKWYRHVHTRVCKTRHRSPLPRLSANQVSVFHAANTCGSLNFQLLSGKYRWRDGKPATDKVPSRKARITAYFLLRLPCFVSRRKKANLRTLCGVRSRNKFYSYPLPSPPRLRLSSPWEALSV